MRDQDNLRTAIDKPCEYCGQTLHIATSRLARGEGRYCNRKCRNDGAPQRFWARTDRSGECWLWTGSTRAYRYGSVRWGPQWRVEAAHRVAWELTYGTIPKELEVCHRCDVPLCIRPDHLFLGTQADNMQDCVQKGRRDTMPRGERHHKAKLTATDVRSIRSRHAEGETLTALGREYGVTKENLHSVVTRETWRHVA